MELESSLCRLGAMFLSGAGIAVLLVGCAGKELCQVSYLDFLGEREQINIFAEKGERVSHAEIGFQKIESFWVLGSDAGFKRILQLANQLLTQWPDCVYAGSSANRAAWACLFLLEDIEDRSQARYFELFDENVLLLYKAVCYADEAAKTRSPDNFWLKASSEIETLAGSGFADSLYLLLRYLGAQKLLQIDALKSQGRTEPLEQARRILESMKCVFLPEWLRQVIEHDIEQIKHELERPGFGESSWAVTR